MPPFLTSVKGAGPRYMIACDASMRTVVTEVFCPRLVIGVKGIIFHKSGDCDKNYNHGFLCTVSQRMTFSRPSCGIRACTISNCHIMQGIPVFEVTSRLSQTLSN